MTEPRPIKVTSKVRRDALEGRRGNASERLDILRRPNPKTIHLQADDPNLTGVAGLVAFGVWVRAQGIDAEITKNFGGMKVGPWVRYGMAQQIRMILDAHVAGVGRVFGLEALAGDPLFVRLAGGCISSIDTVYDDLRRFDVNELALLDAMVSEQALADLRKKPPKELHLDLDTTVEVVFGTQMEGAVPGSNPRYHGRPSYHPILMTVAETGALVGVQLRRGDTSMGDDDADVLRTWIQRVREAVGPACKVFVRIDAAGDCTTLLRTIQDAKCYFVIKAKLDEGMQKAIVGVSKWDSVDYDDKRHPIRQTVEMDYQRGVWKDAKIQVRFVVVRERDQLHQRGRSLWDDLDWTCQGYLTNYPVEAEDADEIARRYQGRAEIEPTIAELKNAWGFGQFSTNGFDANHAMLLLKALAYNLFSRYVASRHPEFAKWRSPWQRIVLVRVPGRLVTRGRRIFLHVPPHARRMLN